MVRELEDTGDFRVLRRLARRKIFNPRDTAPSKIGILLDVETTGRNPAKDEIIELALVPFFYGQDGQIYEVKEPYQSLRQPSAPIPPEISEITGITNDMVKGQEISISEVGHFIADAALIIAHNAQFDRPFAERLCPAFASKPWACSMTQIPWEAEGFDGTKLKYIAANFGFFYEAHRAQDDCFATVEILSMRLPKSRTLALGKLLEGARQTTIKITAIDAPYDKKDALKARNYRWNDGANGQPKGWTSELAESDLAGELAYLTEKVYEKKVSIPMQKITAHDRFSDRPGIPYQDATT